jgi:carbon-monoxide dehydrogenase medium subunit
MYPFTYHRPNSIAEALAIHGSANDARFLAGGQTLLPTMKQRLASPSDLIDLARIPGLDAIKVTADEILIGAAARHCDVANSQEVRKNIPALALLAGAIGDPAVRHRGTLGGSVANNDPSADYPAACLGLGARIRTNEREIPADEFFTGMFTTSLDDHELITAVAFPIPKRAAYSKFPNPASRYAMVGVFVAQFENSVRVAVTGAGPSVFRASEMERALARNFTPDAAANIEISPDGLNRDLHGTSEYRAHLITVMAKRAVASAFT